MTMRRGEVETLIGRRVHFNLGDIYFPEDLEGEVIRFSDSGAQRHVYAEIKVDRISQRVLVRVDKLKLVPARTS
jgi:hypothetical protein